MKRRCRKHQNEGLFWHSDVIRKYRNALNVYRLVSKNTILKICLFIPIIKMLEMWSSTDDLLKLCYYYMAQAKRMCCKEMCEVLKEAHFSLAYFSFVSYSTGLTCLENKLRPEVCMLMFPWFKMRIINPLSCSVFYGLL